jgi:hypothetical protein
MKFICLGYLDEEYWESLSDGERDAMVKACTDFDVELHKGGHFASGAALQPAATATTVRWKDGKPFLTDGPFAETKELLGGILVLEAKDKEEAVRIIMRHPGIRVGGFEVRPADEAFMSGHPILKLQ